MGAIAQNDSIIFSKTDWDSDLKTGNQKNENSTLIDSVSYSLFSMQGIKIDMNLCNSTQTNIKIQLKGYNNTKNGSDDLFDVNSAFYNDRCLPISSNLSAATIDEKRAQFDNLNYTCGGTCTFQAIDPKTNYISCNCNSSLSNIEVTAEFGKIFLTTLESLNIMIVGCFYDFILYVINIFDITLFIYNYSLIF